MSTILIVDDDAQLRQSFEKLLSSEGHEIIEAENGVKAVETYKTSRPDVVLMDITMPEMDGLTALREIRSYDSSAKVVMLTALGQESVVLEAIKAGARDFVVKPFEKDRVLSAVAKLVS